MITWYCPNCDHENESTNTTVKFRCGKCQETFDWIEIKEYVQEKSDDEDIE